MFNIILATNKDLLTSLISFGVIVVIAVVAYFALRGKKPTEEDKAKAKEFLEGLRDDIYNLILDIIKNFNYNKYDNFIDIEMEILDAITYCAKRYICNQLEKCENVFSVLALKLLNSGMIEKFITECIDAFDIDINIAAQMESRAMDAIKENAETDEALTKEFNNEKLYIDNPDEIVYIDAQREEPTEEELAQLNPPREDGEEPFNPEDESMEIVEAKEE